MLEFKTIFFAALWSPWILIKPLKNETWFWQWLKRSCLLKESDKRKNKNLLHHRQRIQREPENINIKQTWKIPHQNRNDCTQLSHMFLKNKTVSHLSLNQIFYSCSVFTEASLRVFQGPQLCLHFLWAGHFGVYKGHQAFILLIFVYWWVSEA